MRNLKSRVYCYGNTFYIHVMRLFQIAEPEEKLHNQGREEELIVGIDLGTTNSLLSYFDGGIFHFVQEYESRLIPSVVAIDELGSMKAGGGAQEKEGCHTVRSIKRYMGKRAGEVSGEYEIVQAGDDVLKLKFATQLFTPQEISATILRHLKQLAEKQFGKIIKKAIITVPAYFDENSRQATKDAAIIAGLEVLRLISEPTAAAICYGLDLKDEGLYMVYDLGGGTFDVTLLRMQMGVFQVIATGGNNSLGGDDVDALLLRHLKDKYNATPLDSSTGLLEAKRLKELLSQQDEFEGEVLGTRLKLSRIELNNIIAPLIDDTLNLLESVLADAKFDASEIKQLILVGGATKMPQIMAAIKHRFGFDILNSIDPEEVVAKGAALQAYNLSKGSQNLLLDVIPISLALEVADGATEKLILRNSTIPISQSITFTTQADGQTGFILHVLQGESEKTANCRSLARLELKGLPAMPKGALRLNVTFSVDADGLLRVDALEELSGKSVEVEVKPSFGLTEAEIRRLLVA